jgi:hypothetical protein
MTEPVRHLRAAPPPPQAPRLPDVSWLSSEAPRRPGELYEPVRIGARAEHRLELSAGRASLPAELVGRLLVEADLLRRDQDRRSFPLDHLDQAAAEARVTRRLSAAESAYLKALRGSHEAGKAGALIVPVRLLGRVGEVDLATAMLGDPLRAASWERAALLQGRTMSEWGLSVELERAARSS